MTKRISHLRAIVYTILGFTVWVVSDSCTKLAGQSHVPYWQILVFASLAGAITIFLIMAVRGRLHTLVPRRFKLEIFRSLFLVGGAFMNMISFTHLPLTNVYVVVFMGPMLIALLASLLMHEHLSRRQGLAIFAGFCGVLLAVNPAAIDFQGGTLTGYVALLFLLIFYVGGMLMMRFMGRTEHSESMAFLPFIVRLLVLLPVCLLYYEPMTFMQGVYVTSLGVLGAIGGLLVTAAFKHAPAAVVSPFHYSQIITGAILGYLIWGDVPTWNLVAGAMVIIFSGLYIAHHARRPVEEPAALL